MADISVIIPVKNDEKNIRESVISVLNQRTSRKFEVIVVDNGSTDGTVEQLKGLPIRMFRHHRPSAAAARNVGIKEAKGKMLLFTDADIIADRDWMEKHLEAQKKYDVVMGKTVLHPGYKGSLIAKSLEYGLLPYFDFHFLDNDPEELEFWNLYTSNLSIKRSVFDKVGLYDENFKFAGSEDTEFGYRLMKNKIAIGYWPGAIILHKHKDTFKPAWRRAVIAGRQANYLRKVTGKAPRKSVVFRRARKLFGFRDIDFADKVLIFFMSIIFIMGFFWGSLTVSKMYPGRMK